MEIPKILKHLKFYINSTDEGGFIIKIVYLNEHWLNIFIRCLKGYYFNEVTLQTVEISLEKYIELKRTANFKAICTFGSEKVSASFNVFYLLKILRDIESQVLIQYNSNPIFLEKIDKTLVQSQACVICEFFFQRLDRLLDVAEACPDMLDTTMVRERQREWAPDPGFFSQWKLLFQAKMREDKRKEMGLKPDGDHVYYVTAKICNDSNKTEPFDSDETFLAEDISYSKKNVKKMLHFTNDDNSETKVTYLNHEQSQENDENNPDRMKKEGGKGSKNEENTKIVINNINQQSLSQDHHEINEENHKNSTGTQNKSNSTEISRFIKEKMEKNPDFQDNLAKIEQKENEFFNEQGFVTNSIKNENNLSFDLHQDSITNSFAPSDSKDYLNTTDQDFQNRSSMERKKITFEDIDNKLVELPHSFTVTHEFQSNSSKFEESMKEKKLVDNIFNEQQGKKLINVTAQVFINQPAIESKTENNGDSSELHNSLNSIENHNVLNLRSSLNLLNSLANKTLSSMASLSRNNQPIKLAPKNQDKQQQKPNPFDIFQHFRFQDRRKPVSFLQIPINVNNANSNSVNVVSNTNLITDVTVTNCSGEEPNGPPGDNNSSKTHLAYYDVKHPTTKRIIDRNKGTVTTITDLGSVTKTIVMNPEDIDSYLEVEHELDEQFNKSDAKTHYNTHPLVSEYDKPYDIGDFLDQAENMGSTEETSEDAHGKTETKYKYKTKMEVNSPKQFLIKRVQTNNLEGVKVNNRSYEYGKTLNNYSFDDVYNDNPEVFAKGKTGSQDQNDFVNPALIANITSKSSILVKEVSNISQTRESTSEGGTEVNCCLTEPCHFLKPCVKENYSQNLRKAFVAGSFLQIQKSKRLEVRKRTRFPTPQFECVQRNVIQVMEYLCSQEISSSYQKYCKVFKEMMNIIIEGLLYRDSMETLCRNVKMC